MSKRQFSEITLAYCSHVAALDRARRIFEEEARQLNRFVLAELTELVGRPLDSVIPKVRWSDPRDWWSTARDVAWLNYFAATQLSLDIRQPQYKNFKRAAGYLYFETVFDHTAGQFAFQCRFENKNLVHPDLDEEVMKLVKERGVEIFPDPTHIKSNTAVLFRRPLASDLFDNLTQYVNDATMTITAAVNQIFPDADYAAQGEENGGGD